MKIKARYMNFFRTRGSFEFNTPEVFVQLDINTSGVVTAFNNKNNKHEKK